MWNLATYLALDICNRASYHPDFFAQIARDSWIRSLKYARLCPHIASSQKPVNGEGLCSNQCKKLFKCIDDSSACVCKCIRYTCTCQMYAHAHTGTHSNSCPLSIYTCAHTPFTHLSLPLPLQPTYTLIQKPTWRTVPSSHPSNNWSRSKALTSTTTNHTQLCLLSHEVLFYSFMSNTAVWLADCHLYSSGMVWQVWVSIIWGTYSYLCLIHYSQAFQ